MDPTTQGVWLALLGVLIGAGTTLAWRFSESAFRGPPPAPRAAEAAVVPAGVATVLAVLRSSALVVDENDDVLQASAAAYALGLVRDGRVRNETVASLVAQVRRDQEIRETELVLDRGPGVGPLYVVARVAPLSSRLVLVLAEDRTHARRVEEIRRDFVVNVSHELKTPVGALMLLAEAVQEAADDPAAVHRFAGRMQDEALRLQRLVQQIIELSRLQSDGPPSKPRVVEVDKIVQRVVEFNATEAMAKSVEVAATGTSGLRAVGDADQLALALSNLVANAIAYSSEGSTVSVNSRAVEDGMLEITVTDQGIGIPRQDLERIFERFYRVDRARHRSTGGTGLGLSIVKHVAASHGGEVKVWSMEGEGSTFTMRLPRETRPASAPPASTAAAAGTGAAAPAVPESALAGRPGDQEGTT